MSKLQEYLEELGYANADDDFLIDVNEKLDPDDNVEFLVNKYPLPSELKATIDQAHQIIEKQKRALSQALLEHFQQNPSAKDYIRKQQARQEKLNLLHSQKDALEARRDELEEVEEKIRLLESKVGY